MKKEIVVLEVRVLVKAETATERKYWLRDLKEMLKGSSISGWHSGDGTGTATVTQVREKKS